jgi:CheY-like chemotaxis protein
MRVLIIDDEERVGIALERCLNKEHEVELVSSSPAAVARIVSGERFDAILCDVVMPEMTGQEVFQAVAAILPGQARRIIFMSGRVTEVKCSLGVVRCIQKPFDMSVVRRAISGFLPIRLSGLHPSLPPGARFSH